MKKVLTSLWVFCFFIFLWQLVIWLASPPAFILPAPIEVARKLFQEYAYIAYHAKITLIEIILGMGIGILLGALAALVMISFKTSKKYLLPILVVSQAIPVFALAPLLVLWLGVGLASKIAMAVLIVFFPVTSTFYDGLQRVRPDYLCMAEIMVGKKQNPFIRNFQILYFLRLPSALPAFNSGLKIAAATAPIGAIIGEWVGSGAGLGFLMLHANGRMQTDMLFAALFTLTIIALALYFSVNYITSKILFWPSQG